MSGSRGLASNMVTWHVRAVMLSVILLSKGTHTYACMHVRTYTIKILHFIK
ncbi:hypothetical protein KGM_213688 [Danaus plexippus plexippus]|uniref:Uncharacterized protein n=1 Tax=Danaus plexippus plexippus TaxID=278856 RepID=A0A212EL70_DANPL|nr:hypothetical protein KGM_213688 [Danaus plexippus plexippus]